MYEQTRNKRKAHEATKYGLGDMVYSLNDSEKTKGAHEIVREAREQIKALLPDKNEDGQVPNDDTTDALFMGTLIIV